jgi:hypothetical protein
MTGRSSEHQFALTFSVTPAERRTVSIPTNFVDETVNEKNTKIAFLGPEARRAIFPRSSQAKADP